MAALVPIAEFADTLDAGRINVIVPLGQNMTSALGIDVTRSAALMFGLSRLARLLLRVLPVRSHVGAGLVQVDMLIDVVDP
jgi:hypothetical protein